MLGFVGLDPSPALREAVLGSASPGARHQRRTSAEVEASGLSAAGKRLYAALCERSGPVYEEARRRERAAPTPPAPRDDAAPRGLSEQLAEVKAVLEAREVELLSVKPVLVARTEEIASVKKVLAARDEQLASIQLVLAARESELGFAKEQLASLKAALAARDAVLAERQRLPGAVKGLLVALKRLVFTAR